MSKNWMDSPPSEKLWRFMMEDPGARRLVEKYAAENGGSPAPTRPTPPGYPEVWEEIAKHIHVSKPYHPPTVSDALKAALDGNLKALSAEEQVARDEVLEWVRALLNVVLSGYGDKNRIGGPFIESVTDGVVRARFRSGVVLTVDEILRLLELKRPEPGEGWRIRVKHPSGRVTYLKPPKSGSTLQEAIDATVKGLGYGTDAPAYRGTHAEILARVVFAVVTKDKTEIR